MLSKRTKWIVGIGIAVVIAGGGLASWVESRRIESGETAQREFGSGLDSTATPPKEKLDSRRLRIAFEEGTVCGVELSTTYTFIPGKIAFLSVKGEEFDKGKLTVDRQVIPKISEALERKTEQEVRQNYKSISQEVMESLDYTEEQLGFKIHALVIGNITCPFFY